jgi:ATP-dependent DNA helicase PIF1
VLPLLRRAAPTGIAAFNISAETLHSMFRITVNKPFNKLEAPALKALQERFNGVEYLIVDEKSMVGLGMWGRIHERLVQIRPQHADSASRVMTRLTPTQSRSAA